MLKFISPVLGIGLTNVNNIFLTVQTPELADSSTKCHNRRKDIPLIRLLIVEDDTNTLTGLQELLSQDGYKVRGATFGEKAVEMFCAQPDDVVLCDYRLPDIDGLEVCSRLQQIKPEVKLIMITAYSSAEMTAKAKEIGIFKIINKPIALDKLFAAIEQASVRIGAETKDMILL